jgi:hypothetical protein
MYFAEGLKREGHKDYSKFTKQSMGAKSFVSMLNSFVKFGFQLFSFAQRRLCGFS